MSYLNLTTCQVIYQLKGPNNGTVLCLSVPKAIFGHNIGFVSSLDRPGRTGFAGRQGLFRIQDVLLLHNKEMNALLGEVLVVAAGCLSGLAGRFL